MSRTPHGISSPQPNPAPDVEHPSLEVLDDYHRGALASEAKALVQKHLLFCRECQDTLLDLAQFLRDSKKPSRLWSAELTAAWERWVAARDEKTGQA